MGYPEDPDRVRLSKGDPAPTEQPYEGYQQEQYLDPYTGQPMHGGTSPQPPYGQPSYGVPAYPDQSYQQYSAQQYPAGPYGQGYPPPPGTNGMAIGALIASVAGATLCGIGAIVGAILGHIAMGQIKKTGEQGHGMALTAVLVGWIIGGVSLLVWLVYGIAIVAAISSSA